MKIAIQSEVRPTTIFTLIGQYHLIQASDWLREITWPGEERAQSRPVISVDSEILEIEVKILTSEECVGMTSVLHMGGGA